MYAKIFVLYPLTLLQISPEVYSPVAKERHFKQTLLERLADNFLHCGNMTNLIFLAENYRSQQEIVEFCYKTFYRIPKGFAIARTREICHPSFPPLSFFSVEGEAEEIKSDSQLPNALQYVNVHEAQEIVRRVKTLQENWPVQWGLLSNGKPDLQQIGVVTFYHDQVCELSYYPSEPSSIIWIHYSTVTSHILETPYKKQQVLVLPKGLIL